MCRAKPRLSKLPNGYGFLFSFPPNKAHVHSPSALDPGPPCRDHRFPSSECLNAELPRRRACHWRHGTGGRLWTTSRGSRNGPRRAPWPVVFNVSSSRRLLAAPALLCFGDVGGLFRGHGGRDCVGQKEKVVGDMNQMLLPFQLLESGVSLFSLFSLSGSCLSWLRFRVDPSNYWFQRVGQANRWVAVR